MNIRGLTCLLIFMGAIVVGDSVGAVQPASPYVLLATRLPKSVPPDSLPLCLPKRVVTLLGVGTVAARDADLLLETVAELVSEPVVLPGDMEQQRSFELAHAILRATKVQPSTPDLHTETALAKAVRATENPEERVCGALELARLHLRMRGVPEARAAIALVRKAFEASEPDDSHEAIAAYYEAEATYQSAEPVAAIDAYAALPAMSGAFRDAVELRRTELRALVSPAKNTLEAFERAIVKLHGERGGGSAVQLAELAYANGELELAERWLHRIDIEPLLPKERAAVAIRRADALVALHRRAEAGEVLRGVATGMAGTPAGALAGIRLIEHGLVPLRDSVGAALLAVAERSTSPWVSRNAKAVAAHRSLGSGELNEALEYLVRVSFDSPNPRITPTFREDLRDVIAQLMGLQGTGGQACEELLIRLGTRRATLLRHIETHRPYAILAGCYAQAGLYGPALDTYRAMTRRFGPEATAAHAVETSRAYFLSGSRATARAAAEANAVGGGPQRDAWRLLLAEIEVADKRLEAAAQQLLLVTPASLGSEEFSRYLSQLVSVAGRVPNRAIGAALFSALTRTEARQAPSFGEAALIAADLRLADGDPGLALVHYREAAGTLPAGPLKSRASYWADALSGREEAVATRPTATPNGTDPWAEVVDADLRIEPLRRSLGASGAR